MAFSSCARHITGPTASYAYRGWWVQHIRSAEEDDPQVASFISPSDFCHLNTACSGVARGCVSSQSSALASSACGNPDQKRLSGCLCLHTPLLPAVDSSLRLVLPVSPFKPADTRGVAAVPSSCNKIPPAPISRLACVAVTGRLWGSHPRVCSHLPVWGHWSSWCAWDSWLSLPVLRSAQLAEWAVFLKGRRAEPGLRQMAPRPVLVDHRCPSPGGTQPESPLGISSHTTHTLCKPLKMKNEPDQVWNLPGCLLAAYCPRFSKLIGACSETLDGISICCQS